ncbi:hypothetical protein [Bradyrhizobium centrolobii]|uniref:hypothetical protein n=1 Tax=Bradyrhizobium centrolobii TaxID=1505087 RepID=UPI000A4EEE6A|nr:hypothetical protein [Bradyrhizobium centrolobii]
MMSPLGFALVNFIRAEIDSRDMKTLEERAALVEQGFRDLIKKELVILNVVKERNAVD